MESKGVTSVTRTILMKSTELFILPITLTPVATRQGSRYMADEQTSAPTSVDSPAGTAGPALNPNAALQGQVPPQTQTPNVSSDTPNAEGCYPILPMRAQLYPTQPAPTGRRPPRPMQTLCLSIRTARPAMCHSSWARLSRRLGRYIHHLPAPRL
jgi:hypothetical protein